MALSESFDPHWLQPGDNDGVEDELRLRLLEIQAASLDAFQHALKEFAFELMARRRPTPEGAAISSAGSDPGGAGLEGEEAAFLEFVQSTQALPRSFMRRMERQLGAGITSVGGYRKRSGRKRRLAHVKL